MVSEGPPKGGLRAIIHPFRWPPLSERGPLETLPLVSAYCFSYNYVAAWSVIGDSADSGCRMAPDIIGRFRNASEAPAAVLYDAESQLRPPAMFKTTVVNGYHKLCLCFSHWQTKELSLPMICLGQILRLRAVLFEP